MITVTRYHAGLQKEWNTFVEESANGTFLLDRGFMEYHKDRFNDHSLLLYENNTLVALLPANEDRKNIFSHGGLTYGGLIVSLKHSLLTTLACFTAIKKYYHRKNFSQVLYKPVPVFFHTHQYLGDQYALFLANARLSAMNTGFVIPLPAQISKKHMRVVKKAQKYNLRIEKSGSCASFWQEILTPHLARKFHTKPIHTLSEIELLRTRFPEHILQYNALLDNRIVAGVTIFWDRGVAHTQYIASSDKGRAVEALGCLFWHLLTHDFAHARFFSFGSTNMGSADGRALAEGLARWKEGFGAVAYPYPCYTFKTHD